MYDEISEKILWYTEKKRKIHLPGEILESGQLVSLGSSSPSWSIGRHINFVFVVYHVTENLSLLSNSVYLDLKIGTLTKSQRGKKMLRIRTAINIIYIKNW
jgi:hypothetical protein